MTDDSPSPDAETSHSMPRWAKVVGVFVVVVLLVVALPLADIARPGDYVRVSGDDGINIDIRGGQNMNDGDNRSGDHGSGDDMSSGDHGGDNASAGNDTTSGNRTTTTSGGHHG